MIKYYRLGANSVATLATRLTQQDKGLADFESFKVRSSLDSIQHSCKK